MKQYSKIIIIVSGLFFIPLLWVTLKYIINIEDRFLPSPAAVFKAMFALEPTILVHSLHTISRMFVGSFLGVVFGVTTGLFLHKWRWLSMFLMPSVQSIRSIPPIATVPFFLLWFGFSELGRYIMIVTGIGFNIAVATYQIVEDVPEKYTVMFRSFGTQPQKHLLNFALPRTIEAIVPTIRFSVSTAVGLVIVSELLGSQTGLGYLIQTSRSTFSMHTIFLATIVLGVISAGSDFFVKAIFNKVVYWKFTENNDQ